MMNRTSALALTWMLAATSVGLAQAPRYAADLHTVLASEARGEEPDRSASLQSLRSKNASELVWWQSGHVRINDEWSTYEDAVARTTTGRVWPEYQKRRKNVAEAAKDQFKLAQWCTRNQLPDQHRFHMRKAIAADASFATPKNFSQMQYTSVGNNRWLPPAEANQMATEREFIDDSLRKWGKTCIAIRERLAGSEQQVDEAQKRLDAITAPSAVPTLDFVLGRANADCARRAVHALARIPSARSTAVLAKYSVFSPFASVRENAITALEDRPFEHFVPLAMDLMATEAKVHVLTNRGLPTALNRFGRPAARLVAPDMTLGAVITRETAQQFQIARFETVVNYLPNLVVTSNPGSVENSLRHQMRLGTVAQAERKRTHEVQQILRLVSERNELTARVNRRVVSLLSAVTNQTLPEEPTHWWSWWNSYTDTALVKKEVLEVERFQREEQAAFVVDCFVSGTPVFTETGRRPIDQVIPGDRVLATNIETGEVSFKLVEATTVREPARTLALTIGNDTVVCTGGHQFWISGSGWKRARDLLVGDRVRTLTGTAEVIDVEPQKPARTYSMVTEEDHTYFVGNSGFLVQDVLLPAPTDMVLPGLSRFELAE